MNTESRVCVQVRWCCIARGTGRSDRELAALLSFQCKRIRLSTFFFDLSSGTTLRCCGLVCQCRCLHQCGLILQRNLRLICFLFSSLRESVQHQNVALLSVTQSLLRSRGSPLSRSPCAQPKPPLSLSCYLHHHISGVLTFRAYAPFLPAPHLARS